MKYLSKEAAIDTLKRFFENHIDTDTIELNQIFTSAGRSLEQPEKNLQWLSNKMTHLRYHDLITPVYIFDGRKKLNGIRLTLVGKRAIGRIDGNSSEYQQGTMNTNILNRQIDNPTISLNDVARAVKQFRDNYPEFNVVFDVRLKEVEEQKK